MQKKKNIQLIISLLVLTVVTGIVSFYNPESGSNEFKDVFVVENADAVDSVVLDIGKVELTLALSGRQWSLNDKYTADLARINDLFVVMEKVNAKREVTGVEKETIFDNDRPTITASMFADGNLVGRYKVLENEKASITYFMDENENLYACSIPGYNYHIAQLFQLDEVGWRTNYVFASNWTTLEKMEIAYPDKEGFTISYQPTGYVVDDVYPLDTAKMYSYLEQVSFLQVKKYLEDVPANEGDVVITIHVADAGSNSIQLIFYFDESGNGLGLINGKEWALFDRNDIQSLMRNRKWFEAKE